MSRNIFCLQITNGPTKLEHLSLATLSSLVKYLQARPEPLQVDQLSCVPLKGGFGPYPKILDQAGNAYQGQTL
jgi:hypothetical protein